MRIFLLLFFCAQILTHAEILSPAWVELGPGGKALARVVVSNVSDCPSAEVDGTATAMTPRQPVPDGFRPVCEVTVPAGAKSAHVNGQSLPLPRSEEHTSELQSL